MRYSREDYSEDLVEEMFPLWKLHYQEIAAFKDIPLAPDLNAYEKINANGGLRIFTIRDDKRLVGYEVLFVANHPHYRTVKSANQDILFITKEFRQGLEGYKFIKWVDDQLKEEGISIVYQHVKRAFDFSPLLKKIGYEDQDQVLVRRLK